MENQEMPKNVDQRSIPIMPAAARPQVLGENNSILPAAPMPRVTTTQPASSGSSTGTGSNSGTDGNANGNSGGSGQGAKSGGK